MPIWAFDPISGIRQGATTITALRSTFLQYKIPLYVGADNYNPDEIDEYVNSVVSKDDTKPEVDNSYTKPNIICINERVAFPTFRCSGNLTTNEDYMPFMHSLTEKYGKGAIFMFQ